MILLKKPSIEALNLYFLNRNFERLTLQREGGGGRGEGGGGGDEEDC